MTSTISTNHLTLRKLDKGTPRQVGWLRDPEVVRYSEQRHEYHSISTQLRYVNSFSGRSHIWGIHSLEGGIHIGNLTARVDHNNVAEVGILIGEKGYWGKGLGQEAWEAACNWLLDKDCGAVRKLEAGCMSINAPMLKILRKTRFAQEGDRAAHFLVDNTYASMLLFGRFR